MMRINLLFLPKQQHIFAWTLDLLLFLLICITNESTFLSLRTTTCSNQQHVNFCPTTSNQLLFMMKKQETISNLEAVENKIVQSRDEVCWCDGEVVGATGRIGSFLLGTNVYFKPVPRHDDDARPGTFSSANSPIFASVPATQVPSVIDRTIPNRRDDLVFVTNGIPSTFIGYSNQKNNDDIDGLGKNCNSNIITTTVPHFGVLKVGSDPITKDTSPPTIIYGKHAERLKQIFESYNIRVEIASSIIDIDAAAIRKLVWVSSLWLLCHDQKNRTIQTNNDPLDVIQVHELKQEELYKLVRMELYPAALELLEQYHGIVGSNATHVMGTVDDVMAYLKSYSYSMPGAIPNKNLAIDEIEQRNGILLNTSISQPLHRALVSTAVDR